MYIDDIIIYVPVEALDSTLQFVHLLLKFIGLPIAHNKTEFLKAFSDPAVGLGYLYHIHASGHAISISLPQCKAMEIRHLLKLTLSDLAQKQLKFELLDTLAGNLVWASQLDRYSLFRIYTNFLKTWTVPNFFKRAVSTTAVNTLSTILHQIDSIFATTPPQSIIDEHDFDGPIFHIFSDAALEQNVATYGAFLISAQSSTASQAHYYAKRVDISNIDPADQKSLTIDIFESLAFITIINAAIDIIKGANLFLHVDNSTSSYGIVKLTGKHSIRTLMTTNLVNTLQQHRIKPVVAYIPSKRNIGDTLTRTADMFRRAIAHLQADEISIPDGPISAILSRTSKWSTPRTMTINLDNIDEWWMQGEILI